MPQKPEICGVIIHVCRMRITRLDALGAVDIHPNNSYVSNKPISIVQTPVVQEGADDVLIGGCDCIEAAYKGTNKLKRFTFDISLSALEPAMLEMMLGATLIEDTSDEPVPIGVWWPNQVTCDTEQQPNVALEFWSDVWKDSAQNVDWPYTHSVYPSTYWQLTPNTFNNTLQPTGITGFTRSNELWGEGPYGDQADAAPSDTPGGVFYTDIVPPAAACGYQTVAT